MRRAVLITFLIGCGASAESLEDAPATYYDVVVDATGIGGTLIVQDNGIDDLTIQTTGSFTFHTRIADGGGYDVTIKTQPAGQSCDLTNASGTVHSIEVHVAIVCTTNTYRIGGHLTGVSGTLGLTNNGGDPLSLSADGDFFFATRLAYLAPYAVAIATQPDTSHCTLSMGSGNVPDSDVTDIAVDCVPTFSVGGSVSGLAGSITIHNGGDDVILNASGPFTFPTRLLDTAAYHVTAVGPATQQCVITNGDGAIAGADVTNVAITCVDVHAVGGNVTGLATGTMLVLEDNNNAGDLVTVTADGMFTFTAKVPQGATYSVTIATQPTGQLCTPATTTGIVNGDITTVAISCRRYAIAIDEVYARPATGALGDTNGDNVRDASDDEFVEIISNEAAPVDVTGWVIATGTGTPAVRFTFPTNTILPAGGRAVIFGGGTPGGSFGGAAVFVAGSGGLQLTDAPASAFAVQLNSAAAGITLDAFTYDNTTFGSSCTTACASQTRSPSGTGAFGPHAAAAGAPGILWSPGVAPTAAIPKLNMLLGIPATAAVNVSVLAQPTAQFNMLMNPATLDNAHLKLYASPCSALANEITSFTSVGPGSDNSKGVLVPSVALAYATVYCLAVDLTTASAINVALAAAASVQFTTRSAASAPGTNVVISEVGGCRLGTSGATTCATTVSQDEFIELYNPTAAVIDISGWFLQRRSAGGSTTCAATIPAATTIAAGGFYLVGGSGYTAANYTGAPAADLVAAGSLIVGGSESVVLVTSSGTCTGSSNIVDAVSAGAITDTLAALELPAFGTTVTNNTSIERKACFDSTGDAAVTTGMFTGGGHALQGNSEHIGANNADWVFRTVPNPQNSAATIETRTCL